MRLVGITALIAALLDQISKYIVIHNMQLWRVLYIEVWPPFLNFLYGENRGINFGLFNNGVSPWVFIGLAAVICLVVLWWMRQPQPKLAQMSGGLLIGGAIGNVIDRIWYGYVLDFLNMSCCWINNPFSFNVADIFIFAGAIGLAFFAQDANKTKKGA
ncbi:MAG: signal peptidase II [Paracoccaceae bacterium]